MSAASVKFYCFCRDFCSSVPIHSSFSTFQEFGFIFLQSKLRYPSRHDFRFLLEFTQNQGPKAFFCSGCRSDHRFREKTGLLRVLFLGSFQVPDENGSYVKIGQLGKQLWRQSEFGLKCFLDQLTEMLKMQFAEVDFKEFKESRSLEQSVLCLRQTTDTKAGDAF